MSKIVLACIVAVAMLAVAMPAVSATVPAADVYLMPQESDASFGDEVEVELGVNVTGLKAGQINLTYDSGCANVTNFVHNETTFPMGGWKHNEGSDWITFMTAERVITGDYQIGTLTIKCVSDVNCSTRLEFEERSENQSCKLGNATGSEITVNWISGAFACKVVDKAPATADGDTPDGSTTADTDEAEDTNVTSDEKDEKEAPAVNETVPAKDVAAQATPTPTPVPEASPAAADKPEAEGHIPEPTPVAETPTSTPQSSFGPVTVTLAAIAFTAVILRLRRYRK